MQSFGDGHRSPSHGVYNRCGSSKAWLGTICQARRCWPQTFLMWNCDPLLISVFEKDFGGYTNNQPPPVCSTGGMISQQQQQSAAGEPANWLVRLRLPWQGGRIVSSVV